VRERGEGEEGGEEGSGGGGGGIHEDGIVLNTICPPTERERRGKERKEGEEGRRERRDRDSISFNPVRERGEGEEGGENCRSASATRTSSATTRPRRDRGRRDTITAAIVSSIKSDHRHQLSRIIQWDEGWSRWWA